MASKTRQQLEDWLKSLQDVKGKILDIGGAQQGLRKRVNFAGENDIFILDLAQPHESKERVDFVWDMNNCLFSELGNPTFEDRSQFGTFDNVFCLEVTEYLWNPVCAMKNLALMLKTGGRAFVSFHFVYPMHKPNGLDYLRYTPEGAEKLLEQAGFEIVKNTARVASSDLIYKAYSSEGMRGAPLTNHLVIGSLIEARKK